MDAQKPVCSRLLRVESPVPGVIRVDAVPLYPGATVYTYRLQSSLQNAPQVEDRPEAFETPEAALEAALQMLSSYVTITSVYPRDGELRDAIGRAFMGMESGLADTQDLRSLVQWALAAIDRMVGRLVEGGLLLASAQYVVSHALQYFALAELVGIPADFDPSPHLDRVPTTVLQQLATADGMFSALYKAELARREGMIRGWECVRESTTQIRVITQPLEPSRI